MSAFDVLLVIGLKMVGNMFLNKTENKEDDTRTTTKRIKDEALKAFNETSSFAEKRKEKAEKIQKSEMVDKSIKELNEVVSSDNNSIRVLAANLELKKRS